GPEVTGIAKGVFGTAGGMVADPRMWPFFFAGPEAGAGTRFLSRAANSTLQRAATAGLAAQMSVGTVQQAAQIHEIWNRPDIPLEQKYEAITDLILNALMAAHGTRSAVRGERGFRPQPLDPNVVAEIKATGPEGELQIFNRLQVRLQPPPNPSAQVLLRYDQRLGNLPKPKPPIPAKPPGPSQLTPQLFGQLTDKIASLPESQRGDAMADAHQRMAAWMLDRKGKSFLGPDHKLHIVNDQAEAEKLALKFINDQVDIHDKRLAE